MLNAHPVREPPQSKGRADEVMKLPGAVKGRGIEINMVMQMALVNVGTDEELVLSLRPAHSRLIADFVCLLRRDLAGRERLPDLKEQGPALHGPARFRLVLAFQQQELSGGGCRITEIGRHGPQLFRIEPIGKPLLHRLNSAFSRRHLVGPDVSCSRVRTSFSSKMAEGKLPSAILLIIFRLFIEIIIFIFRFLTFFPNIRNPLKSEVSLFLLNHFELYYFYTFYSVQ